MRTFSLYLHKDYNNSTMKILKLIPEQEAVWNGQFNDKLMRYVQCYARVKDELQFVMNMDCETVRKITDSLIEDQNNGFGI